MSKLRFSAAYVLFILLTAFTSSSISAGTRDFGMVEAELRSAKAVNASVIRLVPQEIYGEEVLSLLERRSQEGIMVMQFNFFTDNRENSYPKQIATRLLDIRKRFPRAPIAVALESKKDLEALGGKGAAQRNAKTKKLLVSGGIDVRDIHGLSASHGVSHTKMVLAGDEVIAGSNNLTKQSTDIGANNEMNVSVRSGKIAEAVRAYFTKITTSPGRMAEVEVEDGNIRLLTDRLHFDELIGQIRRAQKGDQLGLSMYQFLYRNETDQQARQVFEELLAAHSRGVQLEVYLNRAQEQSVQNTAANLKVAELLMQSGVNKVYFDPTAKISHSKFLYRISGNEKISLISSVNIYRGDFNDNHQLTWVIKDSGLTDLLVTYFKQQIAYDGVLVGLIPKDPRTGLRYQVTGRNPQRTEWNKPVAAARMLRFWRGFKQDGVSRAAFEANVNARLIPETIAVGEGRGLNAYLPSFLPEGKPDFVPDEVAIVDYADEEKYNAIRTTERGRKYGPLHFDKGLFAKQNEKGFSSGSLVAVPYNGNAELRPEARAYTLGDPNLNWQEGVSVRRTLLPVESLNVTDVHAYLTLVQSRLTSLGAQGALVVVDPRYLMLMVNAEDSASARSLDETLSSIESGKFKKMDHAVFAEQEYGKTRLDPGSGINVKFESRLKSRAELMEAVLNEIRGHKGMQSQL